MNVRITAVLRKEKLNSPEILTHMLFYRIPPNDNLARNSKQPKGSISCDI